MEQNKETAARRNRLIEEIRSGEKVKDVLLNAAFPFEKERQAIYFSKARRNMKSDMAHATMRQSDSIGDLKIQEVMRGGNISGHKQKL